MTGTVWLYLAALAAWSPTLAFIGAALIIIHNSINEQDTPS